MTKAQTHDNAIAEDSLLKRMAIRLDKACLTCNVTELEERSGPDAVTTYK